MTKPGVEALARGLDKGHKITKLERKPIQSRRKGVKSKKAVAVRELVREIAGFAPYERRAMEYLKISKDKKALKFLKKRVGGHCRAKHKRDELQDVLIAMRKHHNVMATRAIRAFASLNTGLTRTGSIVARRFTPIVAAEAITIQKRYGSAQVFGPFDPPTPLTLKDVETRVLKAIRAWDRFPADKDAVLKLDASFLHDLGFDSLDHVEITMAIEDEFGFEIPLQDAEKMNGRMFLHEYNEVRPMLIPLAKKAYANLCNFLMCGIIGLVQACGCDAKGALAILAADGLTALQHRGTESAGLVGSNGLNKNVFEIVKGHGLVREVFTDESIARLDDSVIIMGHNRYSTAGKKRPTINCVQPFVVYTAIGTIAIAHNGELVGAEAKRKEALHQGVGLSTDTDSELIAQMIAKAVALNYKCRQSSETGDISRELAVTMSAFETSYSLLVMTYDRMYAIRDPWGNRPLCVGTMYANGGVANGSTPQPLGYVAASESCALPHTAKFEMEVKPGEIIEISRNGFRSVFQMKPHSPAAFCIFEYVYFARGDTILEGQQVQSVREETGRIMAKESPVDADIVTNVPDSSTAAAIGYAEQAGIPYEPSLHRNAYVGRSFIQPNTELRQSAILRKFGVLRKNVQDRRIVLVDDSIVRGNTMGIIVRMLKEAGAKEVHLRIASPPLRHPCFMGINIPSSDELIAANKTLEDMEKVLGVASLRYLSVEGLKAAVAKSIHSERGFEPGQCTACLTGNYPVKIDF
ncbi:unnamed protein product, partial [Mesorhabditis spiculigera]